MNVRCAKLNLIDTGSGCRPVDRGEFDEEPVGGRFGGPLDRRTTRRAGMLSGCVQVADSRLSSWLPGFCGYQK
jgi:hypothetical protein